MYEKQSTNNCRTDVLVHGAWHGGWVWRDASNQLTTNGHRVTTPTLTGLGDRSHLDFDGIGLDTHVNDIVQHIKMENLTEIVLLGWSLNEMFPVSSEIEICHSTVNQQAKFVFAVMRSRNDNFEQARINWRN